MLVFNPDKYNSPFFFESIHQFSKRRLKSIKKYLAIGECINYGKNCDVSLNIAITNGIPYYNTNSILLGPSKEDWLAFIINNLSNSSNLVIPLLPNMNDKLIKEITVSLEHRGYKVFKVVNESEIKEIKLSKNEPFAILYEPNINLDYFFHATMDLIFSDFEKSRLTKAEYMKAKRHTMIFLNLNRKIKDLENWVAICRPYNIHFVMNADSFKTVMDISEYIFGCCDWKIAYSKEALHDIFVWADPSTHRIYDASHSFFDRLKKEHKKAFEKTKNIELKEDEVFIFPRKFYTPIICKKLT